MKQVRSGMQVSAILAAALFLSACGGSGAGGSADPSAAPAAGNPPSGGEQLTMLIPDRLLSVGAGTSEGYYYVEPGLSDALTGQIRLCGLRHLYGYSAIHTGQQRPFRRDRHRLPGFHCRRLSYVCLCGSPVLYPLRLRGKQRPWCSGCRRSLPDESGRQCSDTDLYLR